jgi:hypothetical protein
MLPNHYRIELVFKTTFEAPSRLSYFGIATVLTENWNTFCDVMSRAGPRPHAQNAGGLDDGCDQARIGRRGTTSFRAALPH